MVVVQTMRVKYRSEMWYWFDIPRSSKYFISAAFAVNTEESTIEMCWLKTEYLQAAQDQSC